MTVIAGVPSPAAGPAPDAARKEIARAAREFEAMFLLQMLKQMRQSMLSEEPDEPGLGAATMMDTIDAELSRHLAGQRGGLSSILEEALGGRTASAGAAGVSSTPPPPISPIAPAATPSSTRTPATVTTALELNMPEGRVSSRFGWRRDPISGAQRFHRGVDIAAAYGQEVPAAAPGTVAFSGVRGGYGNLVVVQHQGGAQTKYAHLAQLDVREGDVVKAGEVVGRVGQTGRATGPHLHFEIVEGGRPVDPVNSATIAAAAELE